MYVCVPVYPRLKVCLCMGKTKGLVRVLSHSRNIYFHGSKSAFRSTSVRVCVCVCVSLDLSVCACVFKFVFEFVRECLSVCPCVSSPEWVLMYGKGERLCQSFIPFQ